MPVGAQMVVVLKAFVEHCVSLVLAHPIDFSWLASRCISLFFSSRRKPAAQLCALDRSSYSRRAQGKSTAEASVLSVPSFSSDA
jgi:hypothetical protein